MRHILSATVLTFFMLGHGSALAETCSLGSRASMLTYIQEFAAGFPAFSKEVALAQDAVANDRLSIFRGIVEDCEATLNLTGMTGCFSTANRLASMNSRRRTMEGKNTQGMELSDQAYQAELPDTLKALPTELSNGLPANWRELAAQKGWQAVTYRSRTVGNPGNSPSFMRVLIKIPGATYDRWIQFTVGEVNNPTQPQRLVDMIAVNKQTKKISFNQFWRDGQGQDPRPRSSGAHGSGEVMDSCITCHPNGMRELSPAPGSFPAKDGAVIASMNQAMEDYKKLTWPALDMEAYGPPLGQAEGCVRCHNNYTGDPAISRGALTVMTDRSNMYHKLTADLSMSPTTISSQKEALDYLKTFQQAMSEDERQRMMLEVYAGPAFSSFNETRATLDWLRRNTGPAGTSYLSEETYAKYLTAMNEQIEDNSALYTPQSSLRSGRPSAEETRDWLLQDCEIPPVSALPPTNVSDAEGLDTSSGDVNFGAGGSSASQQ